MRRAGRRFFTLAAVGAIALSVGTSAASAQEEDEFGWFYRAELSAVLTGGNSIANTFGLGFTIRSIWETTELQVRGRGLRTNTGTVTRTAVGTIDDFVVDKNNNTEVTAENYFLRGRLDRYINDIFFYFGGLGWERNTFAGFNSRITAVVGAGNTWMNHETSKFSTTYGLTFTQQDDVVNNPDIADTFIGAQLGADYWLQMTSSTAFESLFLADANFSDLNDLRFDWTNAIEVKISDTLAFRTALQLLFDNQPALTTIPLEQPAGTPTGELVTTPLGKFDTQFTLSLVADF
ncbi:MAG: DUF481 domain-containing protein [Gemmatimonadota bacterium]|nr:DUF481 domain-containing protein [Gemmatimonadota bacterium]